MDFEGNIFRNRMIARQAWYNSLACEEFLMGQSCSHRRTRVIAQDDATTYVECLGCGQLFDTAELDQPAPAPSDFEEDLSDA